MQTQGHIYKGPVSSRLHSKEEQADDNDLILSLKWQWNSLAVDDFRLAA